MASVTIYQDKKNEWRWRLTAANGRIVAESGEGYKNRADALKIVNKYFKKSEIRDVTFEESFL